MASDIAPKVSQLWRALARLPRLPDLLTTANLCCGVGSVLLASQGQLTGACGLVFLAAVFDVFDGLAARALGGGTPLGAQLDSLADMVSFGVAPGIIAAFMPDKSLALFGQLFREFSTPTPDPSAFSVSGPSSWILPLCTFAIVIASAWRLAKFNIDTRQSSGFLGLATPANALFWASIPLAVYGVAVINGPASSSLHDLLAAFSLDPRMKLAVSVLLGILMLSELPLPSLKFKHKGWKGNEVIFLLMGIGAVLALLYGILAVPLILIIYLLSPLWGRIFHRNAETQRR